MSWGWPIQRHPLLWLYPRQASAMTWKVQGAHLADGVVCGPDKNRCPMRDLPFAPSIVGASKVIEGDLSDCLRLMMIDLEEDAKTRHLGCKKQQQNPAAPAAHDRLVGLSSQCRAL